jgi:hypothetical protein
MTYFCGYSDFRVENRSNVPSTKARMTVEISTPKLYSFLLSTDGAVVNAELKGLFGHPFLGLLDFDLLIEAEAP